MSATAVVMVDVQLTTGVWTTITEDIIAPERIRVRYGIDATGPGANTAGPGEMSFALRNDAGNSGGLLGYYSPGNANCRTGWTYDIPIRAVFGSTSASVTSITRSGITATVTTGAAHGLVTGNLATISGADQAGYNGTFQVTVTGASTFTYIVEVFSGGGAGALPFFGSSPTSPASPATGTITWGQSYVKFYGRIHSILPGGGQFNKANQRVHVVAHDVMKGLIDADVLELTIAVGETEDDLFTHVLDAVPTDAQPLARSIDAGIDTLPYAFDNLGEGDKAGGLIKSIADSAYGWAFVTGDGTFRYLNRHNRLTSSSVATFDNTMCELGVPSSLDTAYDRVRVTVHPKTVDDTATAILCALSGEGQPVGPGATVELWLEYREEGNETRLIGGIEQDTMLAAGTDFLGNSAADGSGSDWTQFLTVTVEPFASAAKFTITNWFTETVWVVRLQLRGKRILDNGPQTFQAGTGKRPVEIDMPYQSNHFIGQSAADFIHRQYGSLNQQVQSMAIYPNKTQALMTEALVREPGEKITLTETVTGLAAVKALIKNVELEIGPGNILTARYGLEPAGPENQWWVLEVTGAGELGIATVLGF